MGGGGAPLAPEDKLLLTTLVIDLCCMVTDIIIFSIISVVIDGLFALICPPAVAPVPKLVEKVKGISALKKEEKEGEYCPCSWEQYCRQNTAMNSDVYDIYPNKI
jgi:hypothetical protein